MRLFILIILSSFVWLGSAQAQQARWCARDCVRLCRLTAKASGTPSARCIAHYACSQYKGRPCAPRSTVERRARAYNASRRGGHLSFQQCMRRGTRAGWSNAQTATYCNTHR